MGKFPALLLALLAAAPAAANELAANRELLRKSLRLLREDWQSMSNYLFTTRREKRELSAEGKPKATESLTWRRELYKGVVVSRRIHRDDRPLSPEEARAVEAAIRKAAEHKRPPRLGGDEGWLAEMADALDFRSAGEQAMDGMRALVFDFTPRPGYKAVTSRARVCAGVRGRAYVEPASSQLLRVDAEVFNEVGIGFGLVGRIASGSQFHLKRRPVGADWVRVEQRIRFDVRILLVKSVRNEIFTTHSDFHPFPDRQAAR